MIGLLTLFSQLTCGGDQPTSPPHAATTDVTGQTSTGPFEVLVGAGNVVKCDSKTNAIATAALLDNIPGTVFMAGDGVYATTGVLPDYANCYNQLWGRQKARTLPTLGSLDSWSPGSAAYYDYWGTQAGTRGQGWYSRDLGFWHIVVLNSNQSLAAGSVQEQWLRNDLAQTTKRCTIAIFHHPRFSSANGVYDGVIGAWNALYDTRAEIVINAHYGTYERFTPQRPDGTRDDTAGVREFVVGLGGIGVNGFGTILPNSEVRDNQTYGVLKLQLYESSYDWTYIPIAGKTFTDAGTGPCRGPIPGVNQPPVANPGGPYTTEGTVAFNGAASSDPDNNVPLTYAWDFGDGSTGTGVAPSHTYAADGVYTVSLTVTDAKGLGGNAVTTTATIGNLPPVVNAGADATVFPAMMYALNATWSDPGANDAPWSYTINWGDGTTESGTKSAQTAVTGSHGYGTPGTYTVHVIVIDKDGGSGSDDVIVTSSTSALFSGAGNISACYNDNDEATAKLLDPIPGQVFTLGDNAFPDGSSSDYANCYQPTWGRHKLRTRPVVGNHEYQTPNGAGYYAYFGNAAGETGKGWYTYTLGAWRIIVLNDQLPFDVGSEQYNWLGSVLSSMTEQCTIAMWHVPLMLSSNTANYIDNPSRKILWDRLYEAGVDIVLNGHQHQYERFTPATPTEAADNAYGIRQINVGTGGESIALPTSSIHPLSEVRAAPYGIIKMTLNQNDYSWQFIPIAGQTFTDSGTGTCHGKPSGSNQPPTARPGGPYTTEGAVTFDGSASSDPENQLPLTYAWNFGDGTSGTGVNPTHTYADGSYTVSLTVTDNLGATSAPATTTATIGNIAPTVNAGTAASLPVGAMLAETATFTDPNPNDNPWTYTIQWGDGTSESSPKSDQSPITGSHAYAAEGTYTLRVTVVDKDGGSGTATRVITATTPVILATGDIADCGRTGDDQTGTLLDSQVGVVLVLGDNAYPDGSIDDYNNCFGPAWGRHKARIHPTSGNHDYNTQGGAGYYQYWGAAAGDPTKGYYSYTLGTWFIIAINSQIDMYVGSPQEQWLRQQLATHPNQCVLAYWHYPRWSTVLDRGTLDAVKPLWDALYEYGADIVLNGHDHAYQRWMPQTPAGVVDNTYGIPQFAVGTGGGEGLYQFGPTAPNLVVRNNQTFGVIKFTLRSTGYDWQFLPVAGGTFTDAGTGTCHPAPSSTNFPPVANAGGPYSGENAVTFNGAGSSDPDNNLPLTYAWTFGDGATGSGATPTHTYAAEGAYTVTLQVFDSKGAASPVVSTTATIANVAPAVNAGPDLSANPGQAINLTASFTDPGGAADAPWSYSFDWGDGSATDNGSASSIAPITKAHTYAALGSYTVTVTLTDKDGGTGSDQATVTVATNSVLVGAGNIARCDRTNDEATGAILDGIGGTVFTAGDGVLSVNGVIDYAGCYGPSWGRHLARTRPTFGSQDSWSPSTYYGYFGAAAGPVNKGYYSYDLSDWHIVVLNSAISMAANSAQEVWLKADLAANTKQCTLAMWHHPRFVSTAAVDAMSLPVWNDLYAKHVDVVVNAHYGVYERFGPQKPDGHADAAAGIREFVIGTGGSGFDAFGTILPNSEVRQNTTYGVLKFTLSTGAYSWQFVPVAGKTFTDTGSGTCR